MSRRAADGAGAAGIPVSAEVVGFRDGRTLLMPLGELHGIGPGTKVAPDRRAVPRRRRHRACSGA